ncbi:hypothetical protein [Cyanobium sp. NIES-981]|uniref:hypothetical protein n=1 Tax=Cyanobium sp. NIES-981 TaxID=1851505 RepID=UPI0007DD5D12|nr:hypothetical protein [Cyanobium sp. NIES-981]SBO41980.1 conserved protein of unknown function [Cyanobium sp. NIES-981]
MDNARPYSVISHDGWGSTSVGEFASLAEAQELFRTLCADRWFRTDGAIKGLSIVERAGGTTVETFTFPQSARLPG